MAQDFTMPRFGRAGNGPGESWGDVDNFDVDILTEYLLEDGGFSSNVQFDFK